MRGFPFLRDPAPLGLGNDVSGAGTRKTPGDLAGHLPD